MRKSALLLVFLVTCYSSITCGCFGDTKVIEGSVVFFDTNSKTIELIDSLPPHNRYKISIEHAAIGGEPSVGDIARIAYRIENGNMSALRVMPLKGASAR